MEYVFGKNTVLSFLDSPLLIEIYLQQDFHDLSVLEKIKKAKIKVIYKSKKELEILAKGIKHQGIIGKIKDYQYCSYEELINFSKQKKYPFILMLDGIEDPHNLGAIIRTVEAFSVDGIIVGKHDNCPVNATVAKVSTGAIANVKICEVVNLTKTLQDLKKQGYWIFAAEANEGKDYQTCDYKMPIVLVMGSEGFGISQLVKKQADFNVFIPMNGKVNSLNVSVATAILVAKMALK